MVLDGERCTHDASRHADVERLQVVLVRAVDATFDVLLRFTQRQVAETKRLTVDCVQRYGDRARTENDADVLATVTGNHLHV